MKNLNWKSTSVDTTTDNPSPAARILMYVDLKMICQLEVVEVMSCGVGRRARCRSTTRASTLARTRRPDRVHINPACFKNGVDHAANAPPTKPPNNPQPPNSGSTLRARRES